MGARKPFAICFYLRPFFLALGCHSSQPNISIFLFPSSFLALPLYFLLSPPLSPHVLTPCGQVLSTHPFILARKRIMKDLPMQTLLQSDIAE